MKFISFIKSLRHEKTPDEAVLLPALREGRQDTLRQYFAEYANHPDCREDYTRAFAEICFDTRNCRRPHQTLETLLDQPFPTEEVFHQMEILLESKPGALERRLWTGDLGDQNPENLQARAIALSEYIRYRILKEDSYLFPLNKLFGAVSSTSASEKLPEIIRCVRSTQAGLVDYVTKEGPDMPLNRGAGLLNEARDVPDSRVWTRQLTHIEAQGNAPRYIAHY